MRLSYTDINRILNSNIMSMWTEDGGNFRWGIEIDIYPVKKHMREFIRGCQLDSRHDNVSEDVLSLF